MKNYVCTCGRECRGMRGFQTHAGSCLWERRRSAAFVAAIESGADPLAASRAVEMAAKLARGA